MTLHQNCLKNSNLKSDLITNVFKKPASHFFVSGQLLHKIIYLTMFRQFPKTQLVWKMTAKVSSFRWARFQEGWRWVVYSYSLVSAKKRFFYLFCSRKSDTGD